MNKKNINLVSVLVGVILGVFYVLFVTSFFRELEGFGLHYASSLVYVVVIGFMLANSFGMGKGLAKRLVMLGSLLLLIQKLIEVILWEYSLVEGVQGVIYSTISITAGFVGFLLLLFVFRGVKK